MIAAQYRDVCALLSNLRVMCRNSVSCSGNPAQTLMMRVGSSHLLLPLLPDLILRTFDSRRLTRLSFGRQSKSLRKLGFRWRAVRFFWHTGEETRQNDVTIRRYVGIHKG